MKILLTGSTGQLGKCLLDMFKQTDYEVCALDSKSLDITSTTQIMERVEKFNPEIVINAAAYTAVDKAESEILQAYSVNETGPKNLAAICYRNQIPLIHVSTDYVFDGKSSNPYHVEDETKPQSVYGKSKLAGELAIKDSMVKYYIVRTAWVFSEYGNNFLKTMLRLGTEREQLNIVSDQIGQPTYAGDLARAIIGLIPYVLKENFNSQILHFCGSESCSWYDFAVEIIKQARDMGVIEKNVAVNPILTKDYPTIAKRPANSILDNSLINQKYAIASSDWKAAIPFVLKKITTPQVS